MYKPNNDNIGSVYNLVPVIKCSSYIVFLSIPKYLI